MSDGLSLEKLRIADRLTSLETTISTYMATSEIRIKSQQENINKLNYIIIGNGEEGLSDKVRSLQKVEVRRSKHYTVFYGAVIVAFVGSAWKFIGQLFK